MKTIAFYSYKGGVGRTLAVSHVAYWLSREGKTVFMLDMDLEAPGLHYKLEQYNHKITPVKGLVDFIGYFQREEKAAKSLAEYTIPLKSSENGMSPMWLMPAGNPFAETYWKQLSQIEWKEFLYKGDMLGSLLFLELKAMIEKEFAPDFLLIDSRTGLTDLTGVGMNLLADDAVVLGVNNPENIDGSRIVMEKLRRAEKLPFKEEKTRMHFVLTRIPAPERQSDLDREEILKRSVLERLNAGSGIVSGPLVRDLELIHIDHDQAVGERNRLKEKEWNRYPIALDYNRLAAKVTGILGKASSRRFQEIWNQFLFSSDKTDEKNLVYQLVQLETDNPDQEFQKGWLASEVLKDLTIAIRSFSKSIELNPNYAIAYNGRGNAYLDLKQYDLALADYNKAIESNPQYVHAFYNRGIAYFDQKQLEPALTNYNKAIELDPEYVPAYNNRGNVYLDQKQYELALADYNKAIEMDQEQSYAYNNRANLFLVLGKLDAALADVNLSLKIDSQHANTYGTLSEIHSAMGNSDLFYQSFQIALELDPNQINKLDQSTLTRHQHEERFQALLKKYKPQ
jgi:tetratricopeptide (TPR) repeat protein/MinD-like ATPase involved in chromosome partitioning or flagellar assembly